MMTCKEVSDALAISETARDKPVKIKVLSDDSKVHTYGVASVKDGVVHAVPEKPDTHT